MRHASAAKDLSVDETDWLAALCDDDFYERNVTCIWTHVLFLSSEAASWIPPVLPCLFVSKILGGPAQLLGNNKPGSALPQCSLLLKGAQA